MTRARRTRAAARAFTLVELLVVISIFILVLAIAVPAFRAMLYSSAQSSAENGLRAALGVARDAAARSAQGQDAAAVFTFSPGGRTTIIPCLSVGRVLDVDQSLDPVDPFVYRDVLVPLPGAEPVQLPGDWMVRAYAPAGSIEGAWYSATENDPDVDNWVFPETGFFDGDDGLDGEDRQTFMVRFEGSSGALKSWDTSGALVLLPSASGAFRASGIWNQYRVDREPDPARFVRRVLASPETIANKRRLLGDEATDTVLARAVSQLAVYNERRLAAGVGAPIDRATGCLYRNLEEPRLVNAPGGAPLDPARINSWIVGTLLGPSGRVVETDARIFAVQRFQSALDELTGTNAGVSP